MEVRLGQGQLSFFETFQKKCSDSVLGTAFEHGQRQAQASRGCLPAIGSLAYDSTRVLGFASFVLSRDAACQMHRSPLVEK